MLSSGFNYRAVGGGNIWAFNHLPDRQRPDPKRGGFLEHVFGPLGRHSAVTRAFFGLKK